MDEQKKQELIKRAWEVDSDSEMSLFISTFRDDDDATIVLILCAWMSNGLKGEEIAIERFIEQEMGEHPLEYVLNYHKSNKWANRGVESFYGALTYTNLHRLLVALSGIYTQLGGFGNAYIYHLSNKRSKVKYAHEVLSMMMGTCSGFPTRTSNCTFYRSNLVFYYLYKNRLFDQDKSKMLLPCNDVVFARAKELGIISKDMKSNTKNVIELTNIARDWFGNEDFYKLYDLLMFYD